MMLFLSWAQSDEHQRSPTGDILLTSEWKRTISSNHFFQRHKTWTIIGPASFHLPRGREEACIFCLMCNQIQRGLGGDASIHTEAHVCLFEECQRGLMLIRCILRMHFNPLCFILLALVYIKNTPLPFQNPEFKQKKILGFWMKDMYI